MSIIVLSERRSVEPSWISLRAAGSSIRPSWIKCCFKRSWLGFPVRESNTSANVNLCEGGRGTPAKFRQKYEKFRRDVKFHTKNSTKFIKKSFQNLRFLPFLCAKFSKNWYNTCQFWAFLVYKICSKICKLFPISVQNSSPDYSSKISSFYAFCTKLIKNWSKTCNFIIFMCTIHNTFYYLNLNLVKFLQGLAFSHF